MAYADKLTTMRRFAIVSTGNGSIIVEGVSIEGRVLAKWSKWPLDGIVMGEEEDLEDCAANEQGILVWLDEEEKQWEPRIYTERFKGYREDSADEYIGEYKDI